METHASPKTLIASTKSPSQRFNTAVSASIHQRSFLLFASSVNRLAQKPRLSLLWMRWAKSWVAAAAWVEKVVSWVFKGEMADDISLASRCRCVKCGWDLLVMDGRVSVWDVLGRTRWERGCTNLMNSSKRACRIVVAAVAESRSENLQAIGRVTIAYI